MLSSCTLCDLEDQKKIFYVKKKGDKINFNISIDSKKKKPNCFDRFNCPRLTSYGL